MTTRSATLSPTRCSKLVTIATIVTIGIVGCKPPLPPTVIASSDPSTIVHTTEGDAERPHVPAGSKVTLRLLDSIGSATSAVGDRFGAVVVHELRSAEGEVIVPAGSTVIGRVESTGTEHARELVFELETVRVNGREVPLDARLVDATSERVRASDPVALRSHSAATATFPAGVDEVEPRYLQPSALPGKEKWRGDVRLPVGARLELVLTRPIVR